MGRLESVGEISLVHPMYSSGVTPNGAHRQSFKKDQTRYLPTTDPLMFVPVAPPMPSSIRRNNSSTAPFKKKV